MAVTYQGYTYGWSTDRLYVDISKPGGLAEGDIMIANIHQFNDEDYPPVIIPPSGWAEIANWYTSSDDFRHSILWKRATSSEPSYYSFYEEDYNCDWIGVISYYRGCIASGNPINTYSNTTYVTANTTLRAGSVTPSVADCMLVFLYDYYYLTAVTLTMPEGWGSQGGNTWAGFYAGGYGKLHASTDATGNIDGTLSASKTAKHAFLVALSPLEGTMHEMELAAICQVGSSLTRTTKAVRTATSVTNIHMLRKVAKASLPATSTAVISLVRSTKALLTVTSVMAASLTRRTSRALATTSSAAASILRRTGKALASISYAVIELASGLIPYVLTARDWLVHTAGWSDPRLHEAVEFWGWLPRTVSRSLVFTATSTSTSTIQRMTGKTLSVASTVAAAVPKKVSRILSAGASSVSITFYKRPTKLLTATSGVTLSVRRAVKKPLSTASAAAVSLSRMSRKSFSAVVSAVPSLVSRLVYAWRDRRTPCVECAYVVVPVAEAYIYAPIAEVIR